jgi:hypothetical protein
VAATPLFGGGNSTSATSASASTLAVNKPANVADNDVLILFAYCQFAGTVSSVPSGWTLAAGFANRAAGIYYKHIPTAADESPSSYSFSFSGTGRVVLQCFRLVGSTSSPFDAAGTEATQAGGPNTTLPAASPTTADSVLLAFEYWNNSSTAIAVITHDAAMTEVAQIASPNTSNTSGTGIAYQVLSASGTTGTRTYSTAAASASQGGRMVTFKSGVTVTEPTGIASDEALGSPAITTVLATAPTAVGSDETLGTPEVTTTVTTSPTAVASDENVGSPEISTALATGPSSVASAEALGSPDLTTTVTASPSGIGSDEALGSPELAAILAASPAGIASAEQAGSPTLSLALDTTPSAIDTGEAFGSPTLSIIMNLAPDGIASGGAVGTPAVSSTLTVAPPSIVPGPVFGAPTITATLQSSPTGIATGEAFGSPKLYKIVAPTGIASSEAFGPFPTVTALLTVAPTGIAGPATFGTLTVSTLLTVSPAGTPSQGTQFGSPVLVLLPHDFTATPTGIQSGEVPGHPKLSGSLFHYEHVIVGSLSPRRKAGKLAPPNGADSARWRGSN